MYSVQDMLFTAKALSTKLFAGKYLRQVDPTKHLNTYLNYKH